MGSGSMQDRSSAHGDVWDDTGCTGDMRTEGISSIVGAIWQVGTVPWLPLHDGMTELVTHVHDLGGWSCTWMPAGGRRRGGRTLTTRSCSGDCRWSRWRLVRGTTCFSGDRVTEAMDWLVPRLPGRPVSPPKQFPIRRMSVRMI
jgi:hypothetical protein